MFKKTLDSLSRGSKSCVPFLGLILQWNVEERERDMRGREDRPWSSNGGNKKDADGPPVAARKSPVVRPVDSTFADGRSAPLASLAYDLVNSEIAMVK